MGWDNQQQAPKPVNVDKPTRLQNFITSINNIADKPWAFLILVTGFSMLICCKKWNIDTTIAGGVIGVASNMLQNQVKDSHKQ